MTLDDGNLLSLCSSDKIFVIALKVDLFKVGSSVTPHSIILF